MIVYRNEGLCLIMIMIYDKLKKTMDSVELESKNKLRLYNEINKSILNNDIQFVGDSESSIVHLFCKKELEFMQSKINKESKSIKKEFKTIVNNFNITSIREKNIFTKLFIRDYLKNVGGRNELGLHYYNLSAGILFRDFASKELKKDRDFVTTILKLDGRTLPYMDESFQNDYDIMKMALKTDTSTFMESFLKCNTKLRKEPSLALLFFEGLRRNNNSMSVDTICRVFLAKNMLEEGVVNNGNKQPQSDNKAPNTFVKINGKIEWIGDNYLEEFSKVFSDEEYNSWINDTGFIVKLIGLNPKFNDHVVNNILPGIILNDGNSSNQKSDAIVKVKK